MLRLAAVMVLVMTLAAPAFAIAQPQRLFGTVEFKSGNLQALPKWLDILDKLKEENKTFSACAADFNACSSPVMRHWYEFEKNARTLKTDREKIKAVNDYVNNWPYKNDISAWQKSDYWATPSEFFANSGDCEDFAITKYFLLTRLGIAKDRMRLVVVNDTLRQIPHAVLAVYTEDDILILDSLVNAALSHKRFLQYIPYYSVNKNSRWAHIKPLN
tara:strand:- start:467 stop:1114 length:648 start_codon:yes stop_codon:yes gene_type:complete